MKFPLLLTLLLPTLSGLSSAVVVNFDMNFRDSVLAPNPELDPAPDTYVGLGAAPDSATNTKWNSLRRTSSGAFSSLNSINTSPANGGYPTVNSANVATTVSVALNMAGSIGQGRSYIDQELGGAGHGYDDLMGDFLTLNTATADTVVQANGTIAGLVANTIYDIYFYGQGASNALPGSSTSGQNSLFGITDTLGGTLVTTTKQTGWDGVVGGDGVLTENIEYVKFSVQSNATGQIFFTWANVITGANGNVATDNVPNSNTGSRFAALNAIQIATSSVPEPSVALLGGLGMLGLVVRRRR